MLFNKVMQFFIWNRKFHILMSDVHKLHVYHMLPPVMYEDKPFCLLSYQRHSLLSLAWSCRFHQRPYVHKNFFTISGDSTSHYFTFGQNSFHSNWFLDHPNHVIWSYEFLLYSFIDMLFRRTVRICTFSLSSLLSEVFSSTVLLVQFHLNSH
jgi:hypothetical protein